MNKKLLQKVADVIQHAIDCPEEINVVMTAAYIISMVMVNEDDVE